MMIKKSLVPENDMLVEKPHKESEDVLLKVSIYTEVVEWSCVSLSISTVKYDGISRKDL
ncbi:hypothetical protein Hdeb2414_s0033g00723931 [Helianthus debilis subsp. tardiflorus]